MNGIEKYQEWLEGLCQSVSELQPEKIAVVMVQEDGTALTAYYGIKFNTDKAAMSYHMQLDAVMDAVLANAREIVEAAEEEDGWDGEDGEV